MKKEVVIWVILAIFLIAMFSDFDANGPNLWWIWWFIFLVPVTNRRRRHTSRKPREEVFIVEKKKEKPKRQPEFIRTADGEYLEVVDAPEANRLEHRI